MFFIFLFMIVERDAAGQETSTANGYLFILNFLYFTIFY